MVVHLKSNLHVHVRGIKIKMALITNGNFTLLAEETSSLETANEVTALCGTTRDPARSLLPSKI